MTQVVRLISHPDPSWPRGFRVHLADDGRLLAIGRSPLRVAALRVEEEGLGHSDTELLMSYASGEPALKITVAMARVL